MIPSGLPTTAQLRAYLGSHGWQYSHAVPPVGDMFALCDGEDTDPDPLTVFVPASDEWDDYAACVASVTETLCALERRSKQAVLADLLATEVGTNPHPTAAPVG